MVCEPYKNQVKATLQIPSVYIDTKLDKKIAKLTSDKFTIVNAGNMHLCIKSTSVKNKDLSSIYKNLEKSTRELADLLEDIKVNPSRYVNFSIIGGSSRYVQPVKDN